MQRIEFEVTSSDSATDTASYCERSSETDKADEVFDNVAVDGRAELLVFKIKCIVVIITFKNKIN